MSQEASVDAETISREETSSRMSRAVAWLKSNPAHMLAVLVVILLALVPLYGVLIPPNVDLPEHILISKLLWEKLTGVTNLDMEISSFIGYRLSPVFLASVIAFCKLFGISLVYLPKIVVTLLISIHAVVVATILYSWLKDRSWSSYAFAASFALPAIVSMYAACWFIGFMGYAMAVTLLIPAVFLTERFIRTGKLLDAALLFITLLLVYTAHPFVELFWVMWCGSRLIASLSTRTFLIEWKRLLLLGAIFLPIVAYNFWATSGTELSLAGASFFASFPFLSPGEWYQTRFGNLVGGIMFKADDAADGRVFALMSIVLVVFATVFGFRKTHDVRTRNLAISSCLLFFLASFVNERFIPGPRDLWIAWDYRYTSAVYAVSLAVGGLVLIRSIPASTDNLRYKLSVAALACLSVIGSLYHLVEVRQAYARFDPPAREFVTKVFNNQSTAGIVLPHSRWHPDGTLIKMYICLEQPDCNPDGSVFKSLGGNIWAVKMLSARGARPADLPVAPVVSASEPPAGDANAFRGGQGNGGGLFARPRGITADKAGNIYVADTNNGRIQKFDPDGRFVVAFGTPGFSEGQIGEPNGIVVGPAGIYVMDAGNAKLMKFGMDGKFVKEWKGPPPGFYGPRDMELSSTGQVYIVDQGRTRIVQFDPENETFSTWGGWGSEAGQFLEPTGVASGAGLVFVADLGNNRIQVFNPDGTFVRQWEVAVWEKYPWHYPDMAYDEGTKTLYVTNGLRNELLAFDVEGNPKPLNLSARETGELGNPSALVQVNVKKESRLLVLNTGTSRVSSYKIEPAAPKQ